MGYKFPLASLLRLRQIAEEREERLLQNIQCEIANLSDNLNRTDAAIAEAYSSRHAEVLQSLLAADLHSSYVQVEVLNSQRNQLAEHIDKLRDLAERQVVAYRAALQDREVLDQIRDDRESDFDAQRDRRERNLIDDSFGAKIARERRG